MGQSSSEKRAEVVQFSLDALQRMALGFMPGGHVVDNSVPLRQGR